MYSSIRDTDRPPASRGNNTILDEAQAEYEESLANTLAAIAEADSINEALRNGNITEEQARERAAKTPMLSVETQESDRVGAKIVKTAGINKAPENEFDQLMRRQAVQPNPNYKEIVYAGHGEYDVKNKTTTVPNGLQVTLHQKFAIGALSNEDGQQVDLISIGRGNPKYSTTVGPGAKIPNLTIKPIAGFEIAAGSKVYAVDKPTKLSEILNRHAGQNVNIHFATCVTVKH